MPSKENNIVYSRRELLLVGRTILSTVPKHRIPLLTWKTLHQLQLSNVRLTRRGVREGKRELCQPEARTDTQCLRSNETQTNLKT